MVCSDITYLFLSFIIHFCDCPFIFEKTTKTFPSGLNHRDVRKEQMVDGKLLIVCSIGQIKLDQSIVEKLKLNLASTTAYVVLYYKLKE